MAKKRPRRPRDPVRLAKLIGACGALLAMFWGTAAALSPIPTKEEIRRALTNWMDDFNAGRADRVCDLFAAELGYDYRGFPERGYQDVCDGLHRSLADPMRRFSYALDVKEILLPDDRDKYSSSDLAVARVVWTITVNRSGAPTTRLQEHGMDVFRRQPDGSWKIIRFIAYEAP